VSPHFYTTDEELQRFMSELDEVRKEGPKAAAPPVAAGY
jgi:selenocysteine lyase/cysteine desulfurase